MSLDRSSLCDPANVPVTRKNAGSTDYASPRRCETPRRSKARRCAGVGVVIMAKSGSLVSAGWIRLAAIVARSASKLLKLWTARCSTVLFVVSFLRADGEGVAGATGLVLACSAISLSSSLNSIGASARSMWKVT